MFGFKIFTIIMVATWGVVFVMLQIFLPGKRNWHWRMVTFLGIILTFSGFILESWVKLDFMGYIIPTPKLIHTLLPGELIGFLLKRLGANWIIKILEFLEKITSFNGLTIHLLPTMFDWSWLFTFLPLVTLVISLPVVIMGGISPGKPSSKKAGVVLLVSSLMSVISVLIVLPHLDAVGTEYNFQLALLATILGARLGHGPWICILGLLLLAAGGIIELVAEPELPGFNESTGGRGF